MAEYGVRGDRIDVFQTKWDAIVVGSGAGGGVAACVLAESGYRVLVIERGDWVDRNPISRDHVRNHRLALYGLNLGGLDDRRVFVDRAGKESLVGPLDWGYNNNAMGVGGGTSVYGAQAWRFHPLDFRMASTYGIPAGSSLADWPLSYDELAPWYERVEWELGVSGTTPAPQMPPRRDYPMPALPFGCRHSVLKSAADRLSWATQSVPLAVNSEAFNGRAACTRCQHCVGFACPVDAKNGSQNTFLARALASGNCTLKTKTRVVGLVEAQGRITEVVLEGGRLQSHLVVLACGAIESARLLLASNVGNDYDQVGRNLQGHVYVGAGGLFKDEVYDGLGPGPSVATLEFSHHNPDVIGGGMLADDFILLPIMYAMRALPPDAPKWGKAWKDCVRNGFRRTAQIMGPIQEIPNPQARVTLDPIRKDESAVPLVRLSGVIHDESIRTHGFLREQALRWLQEAGAIQTWAHSAGPFLSAGQHQAGTCRMGEDPASSVTDPFGTVHGVSNLVISDASVHVTNGGFNPFLTVMALAYRNVSHALRGGLS